MKISINASSEFKRNDFQDSVLDRITKTLGRFLHRITSINLTLTEESGQRGGVDKRCRIIVAMPGIGEVAASARHENSWVAVGQAADRARRVVLTKIKRPRAVRTRRYKNFATHSGSESSEGSNISM